MVPHPSSAAAQHCCTAPLAEKSARWIASTRHCNFMYQHCRDAHKPHTGGMGRCMHDVKQYSPVQLGTTRYMQSTFTGVRLQAYIYMCTFTCVRLHVYDYMCTFTGVHLQMYICTVSPRVVPFPSYPCEDRLSDLLFLLIRHFLRSTRSRGPSIHPSI